MDLYGFVPLVGYDGYLINQHGEVYSEYWGRVVTPILYQSGYYFVRLSVGEKGDRTRRLKKFVKRARLVAQTFIPNPSGFPEVNHKDEDKTNDCADNLEWCTTLYNQNYGTKRARASVSMKKRVGEMYPHGAVWVNDGNKEFRCDSESIPIGCVRGRLR